MREERNDLAKKEPGKARELLETLDQWVKDTARKRKEKQIVEIRIRSHPLALRNVFALAGRRVYRGCRGFKSLIAHFLKPLVPST